MQLRGSARHSQRGVGLIEVLIAVLVLSFGMLGMVGLQTWSLRNNQSALERGRREGSIRRDHSTERLVRTLANTFFLTVLQWAAYRPDRGIQHELRVALDLTLEGLFDPA